MSIKRGRVSSYETAVRHDLLATRETHRELLRTGGKDPYPTWHGRTHTTADIRASFDALAQAQDTVTIAGRLMSTRKHGGVWFLDIQDATGTMQLLCRSDALGAETFALLDALDPGDLLAATGSVTKTRAGELSVDIASWTPLAKALRPPPDPHAGLRDEEERARYREVDLLANAETRRVFDTRAALLQSLRTFLLHEGFMEVETPVLQSQPGGAAAYPFRTHHRALDLELTLRVSPELALKRLIVGGYERVCEVGKVFRNEGIDRQHNPEFTVCEFYVAYATIEDLLPLTERLFAHILTEVGGSPRLTFQGTALDFTPPWPRISVVDAVRDSTGVNLITDRDAKSYERALHTLGAHLPDAHDLPSLLDALISAAVRKTTTGPAFLLGAPVELEPLAKRDPSEPQLVQRMQLLAAGMELVKAYTEENDPVEQERRLKQQATLRGSSDVHPLDMAYIEALKVGLPPTAGWGMGFDRLVMLATDQPSIRNVLFFPTLRPKEERHA